MRNPLSKKTVVIKPSGIRKVFDIVSEMEDTISLGMGEPDIDTPWHIRDEGIYSLEKGQTFYTSNAGLKELRTEISKYIQRHRESPMTRTKRFWLLWAVLLNGFSKAYAMTGWRLGYACAPKIIMEQMVKIHQFAIMCVPTTSQYAAVETLKNGDEDVAMMRESYNQRRRFLMYTFKEMGLECFEPYGAFLYFPVLKSLA